MPRVKHAPSSRRRRKKFLKLAKGQRGGRSKLYRTAKESVLKGLGYATRDRRRRKGEFRRLWITRVKAACLARDISYSKFLGGLKKKKIGLNRKALAEIARSDEKVFDKLVKMAKE